MKRLLAVLLTAVFLLAACSGNNDPTPPANPKQENSQGDNEPSGNTDGNSPEATVDKASFKGTVRVLREWAGMYMDGFNALEEAFSQEYPNLKLVFVEGGIRNLAPMVAANESPDIVHTAGLMPLFMEDGLLEDVSGYLEADPEIGPDTFYKPAYEAYLKDGKLYGLPWEVGPNFLLGYNKRLFDQQGITDMPELNSLADVRDFLSKFWIVNSGAQEMVTFNPLDLYGSGNALFTWGFLNGASAKDFYDPDTNTVNFNHPKLVEAVEWMVQFKREFIDDQRMQKLQETLPAGTDLFRAEKSAIDFLVTTRAFHIKEENPDKEIGFVKMPAQSFWLGGWGFGMVSSSKNKDNAWEALKWLTSSDAAGQIINDKLGFLPSKKDHPYIVAKAQEDEVTKMYLEILSGIQNYAPVIPVNYDLEWNTRWEELLRGEIEPHAFLAHMNNFIQNKLNEKG